MALPLFVGFQYALWQSVAYLFKDEDDQYKFLKLNAVENRDRA
jgi:hypothetical protein